MKKLLYGLVLLVVIIGVAFVMATPAEKYKPGDVLPPLALMNIHDAAVILPNPEAKFVHLQSFMQRYDEIEAAGIHEVVVFHSPKATLLPFQGKFPFDVIGDPQKQLYAQFGVDSSIFALLDVRVWPVMFEAHAVADKSSAAPDGGGLGLPADFLIDADGKIVASHYGRHAYDQWSVDALLAIAR